MGGSSAEKNAVFEFLHFAETSSAAPGVSPGGRTKAGETPKVSPAALPVGLPRNLPYLGANQTSSIILTELLPLSQIMLGFTKTLLHCLPLTACWTLSAVVPEVAPKLTPTPVTSKRISIMLRCMGDAHARRVREHAARALLLQPSPLCAPVFAR
jgi:hypothetical protein